MNWIDVNDGLPDKEGGYLCYAYLESEEKRIYCTDVIIFHNDWQIDPSWHTAVTHWMPLPQPPETNDGN